MKRPRTPLDAPKLVAEVFEDEGFIDHARKTRRRDIAFANTAFELVELGTKESGDRTRSADQLEVAGYINSFAEAQVALSDPHITKSERRDAIYDTVLFNHSLEKMIDSDPGATYGEVRNFIMGVYNQLHPDVSPAERTSLKKHVERTLTGMTHEIIGEQLAGHLGYEVEDTSIEDDMRGVDRYININDEWFGVDFKSNANEANKARTKHPNNFILSTGVPAEVIGGKLRLDPADVAHYAPLFQSELEREWSRLGL